MLRRHFLVTAGTAALAVGIASQASFAADSADAVVQAYLAAWNAHELGERPRASSPTMSSTTMPRSASRSRGATLPRQASSTIS